MKIVQNDTLSVTYATYSYDGDGKRVKRVANGVETWQVYGIGGELLAEYAVNTGPTSPQKEYGYRNGQLLVTAAGSTVTWVMPDQLGSTRLELAGSGAWNGVTRHDYLPFGEELGANVGVRGNSGSGYAVSTIRQRFTGYERDTETGLDFAGARYCSNMQGRFVSVDPLMGSASAMQPQSWNRYSYALNRPLSLVDPTGLINEDPQKTPEEEEKNKKVVVVYIFGGSVSVPGIGSAVYNEQQANPVANPPSPTDTSVDSTAALALNTASDFDVSVLVFGPSADILSALNDLGATDVLLYGYSAGGDTAVNVANSLVKEGVNVPLLQVVDAPGFMTASGSYRPCRTCAVEEIGGTKLNSSEKVGSSVQYLGPWSGGQKIPGIRDSITRTDVDHYQIPRVVSQEVQSRVYNTLDKLGVSRRKK